MSTKEFLSNQLFELHLYHLAFIVFFLAHPSLFSIIQVVWEVTIVTLLCVHCGAVEDSYLNKLKGAQLTSAQLPTAVPLWHKNRSDFSEQKCRDVHGSTVTNQDL